LNSGEIGDADFVEDAVGSVIVSEVAVVMRPEDDATDHQTMLRASLGLAPPARRITRGTPGPPPAAPKGCALPPTAWS